MSAQALGMIERGEELVRSLGFRVFRVRHLAQVNAALPRARVQVAPEEMERLDSCAEAMRSGLLGIGYGSVEIDPQGYRTGGG